jgi:DNA-binding CsgD family transcriptional regulator
MNPLTNSRAAREPQLSAVLLSLYRSARELPLRSFQEQALQLIKPLLKFDSAIWGSGTTDGQRIAPSAAHLHEVDPLALMEWKAINGKDKVTHLAVQNIGSTVHAHIATLYAESEDAAFRAYAARWKRRDLLATGMPEAKPGELQWISLYRHHDALYSERQHFACELLMPHFAEALRINHVVEQGRNGDGVPAPETSRLALADSSGRLWSAQGGFLSLLRLEWTQIDDAVLPRPLTDVIARRYGGLFVGKAIKIRIGYSADLHLLRAQPKTPIDALPPQRARIAELYVAGYSYKEIAQRLRLAPPTVRNQITAAYRDLRVSSKAELAGLASSSANTETAVVIDAVKQGRSDRAHTSR